MTCDIMPKTVTTLYILPFLCTNVLNMSNPSCTVQPIQDLLIEVDTSGVLCFLTCLTSRPHQSTIKCMPYNGLLIVVVWVLLGESTYFLLTILVLVLIPLVHSLREQHLYILHTFVLNHNMLGQYVFNQRVNSVEE